MEHSLSKENVLKLLRAYNVILMAEQILFDFAGAVSVSEKYDEVHLIADVILSMSKFSADSDEESEHFFEILDNIELSAEEKYNALM